MYVSIYCKKSKRLNRVRSAFGEEHDRRRKISILKITLMVYDTDFSYKISVSAHNKCKFMNKVTPYSTTETGKQL